MGKGNVLAGWLKMGDTAVAWMNWVVEAKIIIWRKENGYPELENFSVD